MIAFFQKLPRSANKFMMNLSISPRNLTFVFIVIAVCAVIMSLFIGSTTIRPLQVLNNILGNGSSLDHDIVYKIRLPHALCAFTAGGLLALAGALLQILLRNPLADPYILGTSGGAAVATLGLMCLGVTGIWLTIGAWTGSLLAIGLLTSLTRQQAAWGSQRVLLTGVALASGFAALISLILSISSDQSLHSMLFWLMGDLSDARIPILEFILLMLGLRLSIGMARELNILLRGELEARALGVDTSRVYWRLYGISALLTAAAVSLAGCIGFVGLIVPQTIKLVAGHDHRYILPLCVLAGGSLVTLADMLSRYLLAPQQIPMGVIMTLIGVPLFIYLLRKTA